VPAIDTIHRKSLDILASGMSLMGFVSITDSPDRYHKDAIHRSCSSRERRRYPVARACQDQNFFVSLNADFILRSRRPKILRPTLFVEKNQSRNPRRAILVVASSEGTSRRSDDYAGLPVSLRTHAGRAKSAWRRLIGKASMNANITSAAIFASASGFAVSGRLNT